MPGTVRSARAYERGPPLPPDRRVQIAVRAPAHRAPSPRGRSRPRVIRRCGPADRHRSSARASRTSSGPVVWPNSVPPKSNSTASNGPCSVTGGLDRGSHELEMVRVEPVEADGEGAVHGAPVLQERSERLEPEPVGRVDQLWCPVADGRVRGVDALRGQPFEMSWRGCLRRDQVLVPGLVDEANLAVTGSDRRQCLHVIGHQPQVLDRAGRSAMAIARPAAACFFRSAEISKPVPSSRYSRSSVGTPSLPSRRAGVACDPDGQQADERQPVVCAHDLAISGQPEVRFDLASTFQRVGECLDRVLSEPAVSPASVSERQGCHRGIVARSRPDTVPSCASRTPAGLFGRALRW